MGRSPLLNPLDIFRSTKVVPVLRFVQSTLLSGFLAGLAAVGFSAISLALDIAWLRKE
jgi:hypothetical protein